jgi:ABC-type thiamine transport system ATPase subunit
MIKKAQAVSRSGSITMGLKGLENQKPDKLSGGQKQRVA